MTFSRLDLLPVLVPAILLLFILRWRRKKYYYTHPLLFYLQGKIRPASRLVHLPRFMELMAFASLILAVLNPVLPSAEYFVAHEGLNTLMALDLSSSMHERMGNKAKTVLLLRDGILVRETVGDDSTADEELTRLDMVKTAMAGFIKNRKSDRIGVVVFSENGYVVAPMTVDVPYLARYLKMVDANTLASEGQTAIGEGIFTSLQLATRQIVDPNSHIGKLMVILTDGENNSGRDVYVAIQQAKAAGFKLYFIGVEVEKTADAPRLIAAIKATGGNYYDVADANQLENAYLDIDRIEKGTFLTKTKIVDLPYYYVFAMIAFVLLAGSVALRGWPFFTEIS